MSKRLFSLFSILTLILLLVLSGCGTNSPSTATNGSQTTPIELKLGHGSATDNPRHIAAEKFADLVKQKTNGKVIVKVFPNEVLGSEPQMVDAVKLGTLDMALADTGTFASMAPKMADINLPYLFKDYDTAYKVLDGPIGQEMAQPLEANNIRLLAYWENGFREITNSKHPINSPADLSGLKMRVPEIPVSVGTFKALGTNPTPMAFGQLYTALQSKVVDGQENPLTNIYASKFFEVQKYLTLSNHQYSALPLIINKQKWDSLSPDLQKAIQDAANEARDYHRQLVQKQAKDLAQTLQDKGMVINTPDQKPFRELTKDVYKQFVNSNNPDDFIQKLFAAVK